MLVGAPLVARELEKGTQRLVWTQSVTRGRWLAVKLALVVGGCLVVAALLTALISWWRPIRCLDRSFEPRAFDLQGIVALGYMAFAVLLAVAAGALLRRAIPAMVLTLALFLAVRLPVKISCARTISRHSPPPIAYSPTTPTSVSTPGSSTAASSMLRAITSATTGLPPLRNAVRHPGLIKQSVFQCIAAHGISQYIVYQPGDRFWTFQAIETALYASSPPPCSPSPSIWVRRRLN